MKMRKIAVEEAFSIPEVAAALNRSLGLPVKARPAIGTRDLRRAGGYGTMKFLEGCWILRTAHPGHGRQWRRHASAVAHGPRRADV